MSWSGRRTMTGSENSSSEDQGSENNENGHRRQEEQGWQEQGTLHVSTERAKERGSVVLSYTRWALTSAGRHLRNAPQKKTQVWWREGRRANIFNIRVEGNMSPDRGTLEIAL